MTLPILFWTRTNKKCDAASHNGQFRIARAGGDCLRYVSIFLRCFLGRAFASRQRLLLVRCVRESGGDWCEGESTLVTLVLTSPTLPFALMVSRRGDGVRRRFGNERSGVVHGMNALGVGRPHILLLVNKQSGMCWILNALEYDTFRRAENFMSGREQ